jgi:MoxR-like ATPase
VASNLQQFKANDLTIETDSEAQYVNLGAIRVRLAKPYVLNFRWVGQTRFVNQLKASWYTSRDGDIPMNPRLIGKPGVGKTVLAYATAQSLGLPIYFFQATSDTQPMDVVINPILVETGKDQSRVEYVASPLVTAMIVGGVCVFDEGNRMNEKAWASMAPLLDSRRYMESVHAGIVIKAHPNFRFVATMNEDASCFDLPEYIKSRLHPQITVDDPDFSEKRKILEANLPSASPAVLDYVTDFLELAVKDDANISVREGIHLANYAQKMIDFEKDEGRKLDPGEAVVLSVQQILGVRQTRYIKQILWKERAA